MTNTDAGRRNEPADVPRYTLVVPCFNEAGSIEPLLAATIPVLDALGAPWEALFIDDGSTDDTAARLRTAAVRRPELRVIGFPENRGQATALLAGLRAARGGIVLTMDGDGQNDPRDFPMLLELFERTGADLVCGWRRDRHDSMLRRVMSRLANLVRSRFLRDGLHDSGCQLRVMRRAVVEVLFEWPLMQSFLPAMAVAAGRRILEVEVRHLPRAHGVSKYGLARLWWKPFVEMIRLRRELRRRAARTGREVT